MKINYLKIAKENVHNESNFYSALEQITLYANHQPMAVHWLAWAYTFQRSANKELVKLSLGDFLKEIERICNN